MLAFFNYLNILQQLSPEATSAIMKVLRAKELSRGQVWLQEGAVCDKFSFVIKGLLKLYFETDAKEVVLNFAKENDVIISAQSYFLNEPSLYTMRCVEQSVVVYITKPDFEYLLEKFPELIIHYLLIAQEQVCKMEKHSAVLLMPPKERYESLETENSWIVNSTRLTDRLIGGYLGIGANGLSRWRKHSH